MDCREARGLLSGERVADAARLAGARAHVAGCAACQARADQLAAAILSGAEEELSCAECLARIDGQVALALNEGGRPQPPADDPLLAHHLARCPECEEAWRLLSLGLEGLATGALPQPSAWPDFDLGFARAPRSRRERLDPAHARAWLARWRQAWSSPFGQQLSRGALGALALGIALGFAWLLLVDPTLPEPIRSIAPFGGSTPTPSRAEMAATQTMAVQMGRDWVDAAEGVDGPSLEPGRGTPTRPFAGRPSPSATASPSPGAAGQREPERDEDRGQRGRPPGEIRPVEPTPIGSGLIVTGTLRPGPSIPYPPPPTRTRDPYPAPGGGEPTPAGSPPPAGGTPTPEGGRGLAPTRAPAPVPSREPYPGPGRVPRRDLGGELGPGRDVDRMDVEASRARLSR